MNELQKAHKLVWDFRAIMEPCWATPEPLDSLRYAFCEAGEAMDAWLRQQRPDDSRNNERHNDVLAELADCVIMLLTAVTEYPDNPKTLLASFGSIDEVVIDMGQLFVSYLDYDAVNEDLVLDIADGIALYSGMDLIPEIKGRLSNIAMNHGTVKHGLKVVKQLDLNPDLLTWVVDESQ